MVATGMDSIQIVRESIEGIRSVDDTTMSAVEVLSRRLQRLQRVGGLYTGIRFSPEVEELRAQQCEAGAA
jgi:hypothetical protein